MSHSRMHKQRHARTLVDDQHLRSQPPPGSLSVFADVVDQLLACPLTEANARERVDGRPANVGSGHSRRSGDCDSIRSLLCVLESERRNDLAEQDGLSSTWETRKACVSQLAPGRQVGEEHTHPLIQ